MAANSAYKIDLNLSLTCKPWYAPLYSGRSDISGRGILITFVPKALCVTLHSKQAQYPAIFTLADYILSLMRRHYLDIISQKGQGKVWDYKANAHVGYYLSDLSTMSVQFWGILRILWYHMTSLMWGETYSAGVCLNYNLEQLTVKLHHRYMIKQCNACSTVLSFVIIP